MSDKEREVVLPLMMRGFKDCAEEARTGVQGGQTVINPWLTIGGVATSVCQNNEFIPPDNAVVGDVLVLTKPLGTQVALSFSSRPISILFSSANGVISLNDYDTWNESIRLSSPFLRCFPRS